MCLTRFRFLLVCTRYGIIKKYYSNYWRNTCRFVFHTFSNMQILFRRVDFSSENFIVLQCTPSVFSSLLIIYLRTPTFSSIQHQIRMANEMRFVISLLFALLIKYIITQYEEYMTLCRYIYLQSNWAPVSSNLHSTRSRSSIFWWWIEELGYEK